MSVLLKGKVNERVRAKLKYEGKHIEPQPRKASMPLHEGREWVEQESWLKKEKKREQNTGVSEHVER